MLKINKPLFFIVLAVILASCSVSDRVEKRGGYLLTRNTVKVDRQGISQSDLLNFAQPKPNKKFLGLIRSKVWIWDAFGKKQKSRFNRWLVRSFGEPPVLLDTVLVHNSLVPMRQYLDNKGYFKSDVKTSIVVRRGRARVIYSTITTTPFKFGQVNREIEDDTIRDIVLKSKSLLNEGDQYDAYLMTSERDRITQLLKNSGYYAFTSDFIFYEVDTSVANHLAQVKLIIASPVDHKKHERYVFNRVFINTDYPRPGDTLRNFDTLAWYGPVQADRVRVNLSGKADSLTTATKQLGIPRFYEIYRSSVKLRPEALSRAVFVKPGDYYSQKNINLTYNRIQNLGLSSYVTINVKPPADTGVNAADAHLLDYEVRIVRAPVNAFGIDYEVTNSAGLMGMGSNLTFRNRNIFVGAENLRLRAYGAFEVTPSLIGDQQRTRFGIFNSVELGFESGIEFPTLLSPFVIRNLNQNARPKTTLGLGFNYEIRPEYERYLTKLSLSYEWNASPVSKHFFSPVDLSSVSIVRDSVFTKKLESLKDPRFLNQYTNHLILAMRYSWVYNNQNLTERKNYTYFRINIEPAGNLFNLISTVSASKRDEDGRYTVFDIRYAQYLRADWDLRYYKPVTRNQRLVYRLAFGIGIPYGNSISLPFEKGFFAGGANGMRGWVFRSLGPGEYYSEDVNIFEKVGDLSLEGNIEYRFPIYSFLNGGLFTDIGNIWLLHDQTDFPGGKFTWNRALKSTAADVGLGIRFDFSMFIFRVDGGIRVYDPGQPDGDRMFKPSEFRFRDINWNFGIGYPF
ncbi:MAG: BamA/TamA family outer membrane protein [Chloroflexota bacterium]